MSMMRDQHDLDNRRCGACGSSERWFLHHCKLKTEIRTLCTNCVLKTNPGNFCPICLEFFDRPPPPQEKIMCVKCPSVAHPACVGPNLSCFECPPCSKPGFSFFNLAPSTDVVGGGDGEAGIILDKAAAKALVAAARISALLMAKSAAAARLEADRKVKEAVSAKKRAREALERLTTMVEKDSKSGGGGGGGVVSPPENRNGRPRLDGSPVVQLGPKIGVPEGVNGLRGNQLKTNLADRIAEE